MSRSTKAASSTREERFGAIQAGAEAPAHLTIGEGASDLR